MPKLVLVAVGGNALIRAGQKGTAQEQFENAVETARAVVRLLRAGHRVVLTHGNGPQVGAALTRSEIAAPYAYRLPLDCCVAATQGEIGYVLQYAMWQALQAEGMRTPVVTLVTQVRVDPSDSAFAKPTKPIGPFYRPSEAAALGAAKGWEMRDDAGRGMRRVVASPRPLRIVEIDVSRMLVDEGVLVVCCGGGGVPVVRHGKEIQGIEAVIDKDHTAAVLATQLHATRLLLLTGVETVMRGFGTQTASPLHSLTLAEADGLLQAGEFPAGSMEPKIRAGLDFLRAGGQEVLITDPEHLSAALAGTTGTHIGAA